MRSGHRLLVSVNDGHATLQVTRPRREPDRVLFALFNAPIDKVEADLTLLPVATWWQTPDQAQGLKRSL